MTQFKPASRYREHPHISTEVLDFVSPAILRALREASRSLTEHGIRHAICGGVAVGAYGYVRATRDVDFLVGDEAFITKSGVSTFAPGVSFKIDKIPTDMVAMDEGMRFMESELINPYDLDGLPIVSPECLVTMKLIAHRRKDVNDVIELLETGATTVKKCHNYLVKTRPDLLDRLDAISAVMDGGE